MRSMTGLSAAGTHQGTKDLVALHFGIPAVLVHQAAQDGDELLVGSTLSIASENRQLLVLRAHPAVTFVTSRLQPGVS